MKNIILLSCVTLFFACDPSAPEVAPPADKPATEKPATPEVKPPKTTETAPLVELKKVPIAERKFSKAELPAEAKVKGKISGGLAWTDTNGENFVVFSRSPGEGAKELKTKSGEAVVNKDGTETPFYNNEAWLFANHFLKDNNGVKNIREIKQRAPCMGGADLVAEFQKKADGVTDLDNDGFGEATFAYYFTCTTDLSPYEYKLFVIENGDKHVLRGHTRVEGMGGEFKADPSFKGNDVLLKHATGVWSKTKEMFKYED